jgi:glycosyltransferase involved in cell wall biosynthesis
LLCRPDNKQGNGVMPNPHCDTIAPVAGAIRPLWSVMIPTHNNDAFLEQTLRCVLDQAPAADEMQIEVVDDCSTKGDPQSLVQDVGRGRVGFFRQAKNLGVSRNLTSCIQRSRGRFVHLLHGDDYVLPGFYLRLGRGLNAAPDAGLAFCRYAYVDASGMETGRSDTERATPGLLENHLVRLAEEQRICTPSIVVRRAAYERLGGFDRRLLCAEDWEMWVRIAAHYPAWYEPELGACYRIHDAGNTARHTHSARDSIYNGKAIDIFCEHLPVEIARNIRQRARQTYACASLDLAGQMFRDGDYAAARAQVRAAFGLRRNLRVTARFLGLLFRMGTGRATGKQAGRRT